MYEHVFDEYVRGFGIDSTAVDIDQPNRLLRHELEARGLGVVDALPAFRAAARSGPRLFGAVDEDFSLAGHALLIWSPGPSAASLLTCSASAEGAC